MRGGTRRGAGRKPAKIDLEELEKLCALGCTDEELAAWFGVSTRTIESRRKQPRFAGAMVRGKAKGRISIRRLQMKLAEAGNAQLGVWLGKQMLGQRDVRPIEFAAPSGDSEQISVEVLDAILTYAKKDG
jgi:hypothetical protein